MTSVGIDFGTTNCVVSKFENGQTEPLRISTPPLEWGEIGFDRLFPSVFGVDERTNPLYGWDAKILPQNMKIEAAKRFLAAEEHVLVGGQNFTMQEVASLIFAQLRKATANESGINFNSAVVTIPSNSRGMARKSTKICSSLGGVKALALINEPTAAAMSVAHNLQLEGDNSIMVVDWGGGTLDVTVLETQNNVFVERTSAGASTLGGIDFDTAVLKHIAQEIKEIDVYSHAEKTLVRMEVERAKILLSTEEEATIRLPRGEVIRLTRDRFEETTAHLLELARLPLNRCLQDIAASDHHTQVDNLILVGGTCMIPSVASFIGEIVQLQAETVINPMTATSEGAAIAAAILTGELEQHSFTVSTQHALGVLAVSDNGSQPHFSTIIPRNQSLPAQGSDRYAPMVDNQEWLNVTVIEGDPDKPIKDETSIELQKWKVPIKEPKPMTDIMFDITYRYDTDGIIHVSVMNALDETSVFDAEVLEDEDKKKLVSVANSVRDTVATGTLTKKDNPMVHSNLSKALSDDIINVRTKICPFIDSDESANLLQLCDRIMETDGNDEVLLQALENFKDKYNYLI